MTRLSYYSLLFSTLWTLPVSLESAYVPLTVSPKNLPQLKTNPFVQQGLDIDLPNFDSLFEQIQSVSPLARAVIHGKARGQGFASIGKDEDEDVNWKQVEARPSRTIHAIHKIEIFNGINLPVFRFRSSLTGPCVGEYFGKLIMDRKERQKWDKQVDDVFEAHPIHDLDAANIAMGFGRYGDCARLGVGYTRTKATMGITPREQLFLCGLQKFSDGSSMLWGKELESKYDHLFPDGAPRHTRAKSHLFSTTLTPTGPASFDVEYAIQLEIGGNIPTFLTSPVMVDTIKNLFRVAELEFGKENGTPEQVSMEQALHDHLEDRQALLMPV